MTDDSLTHKKCIPCRPGTAPLDDEGIRKLLPQVTGWSVVSRDQEKVKTLQKRFTFKNFSAAMTFLRKVEEVAEAEGHHPDFCVHYNKVDFTLWTHDIGGLHENDFILAAKINALGS